MEMDKISWIMCAASLAHYGLLAHVITMGLKDVDLSPVPAKHLTSLTSCVTLILSIKNVSGCDLLSILTSLDCSNVKISSQSLGREETRALVRYMERRAWRGLKSLDLGDEVTLDIEALVEYSGEGVCKEIILTDATLARYSEELWTWARSRNWREYFYQGPFDHLVSLMPYQTVFKRLD